MRTLMIVRRYRSAIDTTTDKDQKGNQKGQGGDRRNSDSRDKDNAWLRSSRSSEDRRVGTSRDRRNSNDKDKERKTEQTFLEEGFLQICGPTGGREIQAIQDILYPLEEAPYKLQCTCQHCISYSYEVSSPDKQYTEPFMRAINLVFSTICRYGYTLQSTSAVQNADQSSTTTWVWVRMTPDQADHPHETKKEEEDNKPRRKN